MMDKSVLLQQQIRNNTADLQTAFSDLKAWEAEMKRKDAELRSAEEQVLPPIRTKKNKTVKSTKQPVENTSTSQRIKSYDYKAWDNFDVDKACEEVDKEETTEEQEEEMSPDELQRLHDQANELKIKGNAHVKKQEWQKAIDCYTEAIKIFNYDATFFANRALCCLKLNNLYSAEADCTVAIQLDENYVKAYHRRAQARMELKQYQEAKQDIEKLLKLEPSNKEGKSMLQRVNQAISNQKSTPIINSPNEDSTSIEKIIGEKLVNKESQKVKPDPSKTKDNQSLCSDVKDKQKKSAKKKDLPIWLPDLQNNFEIVEPIAKQPHQRYQKPMQKVPIMEVNFGTSVLSKSNEELEAESQKQKESSSSKCVVNLEEEKVESKKNDRVLIQVTSEEFNEDVEIPPVPKTSVQFLSNWNKTKSLTFRYKYFQQLSPESLPTLFQDFLEFDTLNEILQVLNKEFIKRKRPVYEYLQYLSNVKRFRAVILFMSAEDKKVVKELLEYAKSTEDKSDEDIARLCEKYEV